MSLSDLKKIGLTDGEIKIYSALLELGETTRTELAKKSGISPSKIYDVANRLLEKGIISSVKKQGVLHFSPANPHRIKEFLSQKSVELEEQFTVADNVMPSLLAKFQSISEKSDVEVFYGWEGMKTVYNDIVRTLKKGNRNFVFGASKGLDPTQAGIFFSQYTKQAEKKGYTTHIIFNENAREHATTIGSLSKPPFREVRFLYQDTFTEFNFYKDTVLFVMLLKKPIVIRVKNKEAAESFKKFFDTMWTQAKP